MSQCRSGDARDTIDAQQFYTPSCETLYNWERAKPRSANCRGNTTGEMPIIDVPTWLYNTGGCCRRFGIPP